MQRNIKRIKRIIEILREQYPGFKKPAVTQISLTKNPFKILISTMLSARTKDDITLKSSSRLFKYADTPDKILKLKISKIQKLIYPVNFYKTKAKNIIKISKIIKEKYNGNVPDRIEELITLPGVGRKTANLVSILGYNKYGICVDTHVHRISNRLGIVKTKKPYETEFALSKVLQKRYWREYNDLLVTFGQNICRPINPFCSRCPLKEMCPKIAVSKHR